jgi:UDP-N-acetylmuramate dehydrogenase
MRRPEDETKDESKRNLMIAAERRDIQGRELRELSRLIAGKVTLEAPLGPLTTYHIGGKASALVEPQGVEDLAELLRCLSHAGMSYLILGGGSNVLFADEGYQGVVIRLGRGFQGVEIEGNRVRAKAGSKLVAVLSKAREANLGGVEFFAGIPGTLGGAVVGNAGAKKAWIGPFVEEVTLVTPRGEIKKLAAGEVVFGYRSSSLKMSGNVLVEVVLKLKREPQEMLEKKVREYFKARRGRQPRTEKNAGSVFKNPPGEFAGRLIESAGLKGFQAGGAQVSPIHANFIVNNGDATAHDVVAVMREAQKRVLAATGIRLEPEILPLGNWNWEEIKDVWWNLKGS